MFDRLFKISELLKEDYIPYYFNILNKMPEKKSLCLYYEEKDSGRKGATLYIHEPFELSLLPMQINLRKRRDLYSPQNIRKIVEDYVMPSLQPQPVDIHFPVNDFMLEVDPREPEIGFLSRKVNLRKFQTLEENLRIDIKLREKLWIYKLIERGDSKRFKDIVRTEIGNREDIQEEDIQEEDIQEEDIQEEDIQEEDIQEEDIQEEDILILGRIEDLYKIFNTSELHGHIYQKTHVILDLLIFLVFTWLILDIFFSLERISMFLNVVTILCSVTFVFWASKNFILNYLLDPMYRFLRLFTYFLLVTILSLNNHFWVLIYLSAFFLFIGTYILFKDYICSAILYGMNNLLGKINYKDIIAIESLNTQGKIEEASILKNGKFQTIIEKENKNIEFFLI